MFVLLLLMLLHVGGGVVAGPLKKYWHYFLYNSSTIHDLDLVHTSTRPKTIWLDCCWHHHHDVCIINVVLEWIKITGWRLVGMVAVMVMVLMMFFDEARNWSGCAQQHCHVEKWSYVWVTYRSSPPLSFPWEKIKSEWCSINKWMSYVLYWTVTKRVSRNHSATLKE